MERGTRQRGCRRLEGRLSWGESGRTMQAWASGTPRERVPSWQRCSADVCESRHPGALWVALKLWNEECSGSTGSVLKSEA